MQDDKISTAEFLIIIVSKLELLSKKIDDIDKKIDFAHTSKLRNDAEVGVGRNIEAEIQNMRLQLRNRLPGSLNASRGKNENI